MSKRRTFSDEQLTAYLDGEADEALARAVEAASRSDPRVAQRLQDLALGSDEIKEAFAPLLDGPGAHPEALSGLSAQGARASGRRRYPLAFAIGVGLFGLGLGGIVGATLVNRGPAAWHDYAAAAHALYVAPSVSDETPPGDDVRGALDRAAKALGRALPLADLTGIDAMTFKRVEILGFKSRPLIRIVYLTADGAPLALCIIKAADADAREVQTRRMQDMSAATWARDGYEFLLIGGRDDDLIRKAADHFAANL